MSRQWVLAAASIVGCSVLVVLIDALLIGAYLLVTGNPGNMVVLISDATFIEGGLVLLVGAFVEFFQIGGKDSKLVMHPRVLGRGRDGSPGWADSAPVEVRNPGWVLIFLGGLLICYSFALLFLLK